MDDQEILSNLLLTLRSVSTRSVLTYTSCFADATVVKYDRLQTFTNSLCASSCGHLTDCAFSSELRYLCNLSHNSKLHLLASALLGG